MVEKRIFQVVQFLRKKYKNRFEKCFSKIFNLFLFLTSFRIIFQFSKIHIITFFFFFHFFRIMGPSGSLGSILQVSAPSDPSSKISPRTFFYPFFRSLSRSKKWADARKWVATESRFSNRKLFSLSRSNSTPPTRWHERKRAGRKREKGMDLSCASLWSLISLFVFVVLLRGKDHLLIYFDFFTVSDCSHLFSD